MHGPSAGRQLFVRSACSVDLQSTTRGDVQPPLDDGSANGLTENAQVDKDEVCIMLCQLECGVSPSDLVSDANHSPIQKHQQS